MTYPHSSHHPIQSLSLLSSHLAKRLILFQSASFSPHVSISMFHNSASFRPPVSVGLFQSATFNPPVSVSMLQSACFSRPVSVGVFQSVCFNRPVSVGLGWWDCGDWSFFILLIMASNLGMAKCIAPCEATQPG